MNVSSDDQVAGVDPGSAVGPDAAVADAAVADAAVADAAVADSVDPAAVEHARAHLPAPAVPPARPRAAGTPAPRTAPAT